MWTLKLQFHELSEGDIFQMTGILQSGNKRIKALGQ